MTRRRLSIAAVILALYLAASYFGYAAYLANPQGNLLYTPPAHEVVHHYTPSFPLAFSFILLAAIIIAIVVAVMAFLIRFLSTSERIRLRASTAAWGFLWIGIFCLPGVIFSDYLWRLILALA